MRPYNKGEEEVGNGGGGDGGPKVPIRPAANGVNGNGGASHDILADDEFGDDFPDDETEDGEGRRPKDISGGEEDDPDVADLKAAAEAGLDGQIVTQLPLFVYWHQGHTLVHF